METHIDDLKEDENPVIMNDDNRLQCNEIPRVFPILSGKLMNGIQHVLFDESWQNVNAVKLLFVKAQCT